MLMSSWLRLARSLSTGPPVGTKISAAVSTGPKQQFVLQDLMLDEPQPGEVLVKVVACGICHTDLVRALGGCGGVWAASLVTSVASLCLRPCVTSTSRPRHPWS